jgi:hypothetical protein
VFLSGDRLSSLQVGLSSWVEETQVSFGREPSLSEASASSKLFPCENWGNFWKEYFLQIIVFKVEKGSFCSKKDILLNQRNSCISWKKTMCVRSQSIMCIVSLWELSYFLNRILLANLNFQGRESLMLLQVVLIC